MAWDKVIPDFTNFDNIVLAASIFLFYAGMEMNAIHVKEIENPKRNYPIAIMLAAAGTVTIFVLGTMAIVFVISAGDISLMQSLLIAFDIMFKWAGMQLLGPVACSCFGDRCIGICSYLDSRSIFGSTGCLKSWLPSTMVATNKRTRNG